MLNCNKYSSGNICEKCNLGYSLENNICKDFSAGCAQIDQASGSCNLCRDGYSMRGFMCI